MLLRHSPLVSVRHVQVTGVHGPEAAAIEAALVAAARHMSTLDVRPGTLRAAVAPFRVVREVHAVPSFPHGLHIRVIEQLPVAALTVGGIRTAVAADGVVLGPALLSGSLPTLNASYEPAVGQRVSDASLIAPLTVLGAAPEPLARLVVRVFSGPNGLTAAMRNGLLI
jgi:cell division septal protein FtsQ